MAWLELTSDAFSKDVSIESAVCPPKMFLSILSLFEETCVSQPRWPVVKVSSGSADPLDSVFPSDSAASPNNDDDVPLEFFEADCFCSLTNRHQLTDCTTCCGPCVLMLLVFVLPRPPGGCMADRQAGGGPGGTRLRRLI